MQARWLRLTVRDSRTPTTRTQKLSRRLLRNDRGPCRASRRAAVTSLFIRTPIRSQTNRKFYAPVSLLPENVVYRAWERLSGISCVGGHDWWKGAQPCRDAKSLIFLMPSWTSFWLGPIPRRPLIRTAFSTA